MTLIEFVEARLDEWQAMVQAAIDDDTGQDGGFEDSFDLLTKSRDIAGPLAHEPRFGEPCARLIVYNTPRRAMAEIAAKRRILARHRGCGEGWAYCDDGGHSYLGREPGCADQRDLVAPFNEHPDFNPAWNDEDR